MPSSNDRVLILNPKSGDENHVDRITELGASHGFDVRQTEAAGDGAALAREAAGEGAEMVAAAGGDGTINEVVNGLVEADALGRTALAVVPAGTGNNFASNVGIEGIEHAFEVIADGERRSLDLGMASERAFLNSCVGGLTAEASEATDPQLKRQYGVLAYAIGALEAAMNFDSPRLRVETADPDAADWTGEAALVLVGNCRRFSTTRVAQADAEDGRFEVAIVAEAPPANLVSDAALGALFGTDSDHVVRLRTSALSIRRLDDDSLTYSLDGEILEIETLGLTVIPGAVRIPVGEGYDSDPEEP